MRRTAALSPIALAAWLACAVAPAAAEVSPLPASDYAVRPACAEARPGSAGCLALQLVPLTRQALRHDRPLGVPLAPAASAHTAAEGYFGLRPQDLHAAYDLPDDSGSTQTIALVDAYNDPEAAADLKTYDEQFSLPACTVADECFEQVNQNGETSRPPYPETLAQLEEGLAEGDPEAEEAAGWAFEISLDIEVAHATCENCRVVLVEADAPTDADLDTAEQSAVSLGAQEISNSWGGPEAGASAIESAFDHPGVVITASAGDDGYLSWDASESDERGYAEFPASSPDVVAVGGTRLTLGAGSKWAGETVWNGDGAGGGGCSVEFEAQPWQRAVPDWSSVGCSDKRAVADVAADADPYTGVAIYDSTAECEYEEGGKLLVGHWCTVGGTSLASPLVASAFALAGGAHGVAYPARTLYEQASSSSLHDVTKGSNGRCSGFDHQTGLSECEASVEAAESCSSRLICLAATGYDGPTGLGTPDGLAAFEPSEAGGETPGEAGGGSKGGGEARGEPAPGGSAPGSGGGTPAPAAAPAGTGYAAAPRTTAASAAAGLRLSALALTFRALVALDANRPRVSGVEFTWLLSEPARLRAKLARRVGHGRRASWRTLPYSLSFSAPAGRGSRRLHGRGSLPAGTYRLTLTPAGGAPRSLDFAIG